jgi:hypothetical protein
MNCRTGWSFVLLVLILHVFTVETQKNGTPVLSRVLQPAHRFDQAPQPQCAFCNPGGKRCPAGCHLDSSGRKCVPDANCVSFVCCLYVTFYKTNFYHFFLMHKVFEN